MKRKGILCKACKRDGEGCNLCGGYGVIITKQYCDVCLAPYWIRPGAYTVYEGKRWTSWDGREMVSHLNAITNCLKCEGKK